MSQRGRMLFRFEAREVLVAVRKRAAEFRGRAIEEEKVKTERKRKFWSGGRMPPPLSLAVLLYRRKAEEYEAWERVLNRRDPDREMRLDFEDVEYFGL